ncbi:FkbM family methyltransferase [Ramlibacter sp. USB13]|uniref:FkbM family methyltransferase n=1 Tax=Ramlibacter cellulosilyticus TaxID=2764187 RepID=A0A923MUP4_9BURK|nr:FkbM family methyltransferase [Ramlibacter cellulosilyticus]MBC5785603.1 FkbM family methyltransferase [Ramlibacter cellulosilyticus]
MAEAIRAVSQRDPSTHERAAAKHTAGEALSSRLCRQVLGTGWERVAHPWAEGEALRTYAFQRPLVLLCSPDTVGLEFLRHGWSGAVKVTIGDDTRTIVLSEEESAGTTIVDLPAQTQDFEVTIESVPVEGRPYDRSEAWLLGLQFRNAPTPVARTSLLNERIKIVHGDWGDFLALRTDDLLPSAIAQVGSWAPDDIEIFRQHVRPGDLVLDVGANIGHHAVVFSKLAGPRGLVVAVEAQRLMCQLVQANALMNRGENIVAVHAAAGQQHGHVTMYPINYDGECSFGQLGVDTTTTFRDNPGELVEVHPLDDLVARHAGGRRVAFAKIDVQAYELFVLQGMTRILRNDRPTIFIEIAPFWMRKAGYEFTEVYDFLRGHGYALVHREHVRLGPDGIPVVAPGQDVEWDLLAVHPQRHA